MLTYTEGSKIFFLRDVCLLLDGPPRSKAVFSSVVVFAAISHSFGRFLKDMDY